MGLTLRPKGRRILGDFGGFGVTFEVLGLSLGSFGLTLGLFGLTLGVCGLQFGALGPPWADLGVSWLHYGVPWAPKMPPGCFWADKGTPINAFVCFFGFEGWRRPSCHQIGTLDAFGPHPVTLGWHWDLILTSGAPWALI